LVKGEALMFKFKKNIHALVLMVFGLVSCSTTDGKLALNPYSMQVSHNVPWWFGEKIVSNYEDITLKHKAMAINLDTREEFFFSGVYDVKQTTTRLNNDARKYVLDLCKYYAEPEGFGEKESRCVIKKVGDSEYFGSWRGGEFDGRGRYVFANGDKYVGNFRNGMFHGQGTLHWADGTKYTGNFYNDKLIKDVENTLLSDAIKTTGQIILGGLYIAVAVAGSPGALEYQENKNQKAKEAAAYEKGKRDGAIRAERARSNACKVTRNC
jgi:hypothetical protein